MAIPYQPSAAATNVSAGTGAIPFSYDPNASPMPPAPTPAPATPPPSSFLGQLAGGALNAAKTVGNLLTSNEQNFGQDIAAALGGQGAVQQASDLNHQQSNLDLALLKALDAHKAQGIPLTSNQQRLYDETVARVQGNAPNAFDTAAQQFPALTKSPTQVLGDAAGVALDAATAGSLAKGAQSFKPIAAATEAAAPLSKGAAIAKNIEGGAIPTTAQQLINVGKQYLKSAATYGTIGYGYDVANKLQSGQSPLAAVKPGAGTAIGVALPVVPALAKTAGVLAPVAAERTVNSLVKPLLKDFAYGKNPGRAIAQEGITGNSLDQLAQNIADRRKQIGQEIGSLTSSLDAKTSTAGAEAGKTTQGLQLKDSLKPIDDAMQTAAKTNNPTLLTRLQSVKDALAHDLSLGFDESGAPAINKGAPRNLTNVSFENAAKMKADIGDMTRWTGNKSDDETVNKALKQVYGNIKGAIEDGAAKVDPAIAAQLKQLNGRYGDLMSAEIATKYRDKINARQNIISAPIKAGAVAGLLAAPFTGGFSAALIGLGAAGLDKALGSTAVKTRVAAWLAHESPSIIEQFYAQHPDVANVIYKTFSQERSVPMGDSPGFVKVPFAGPSQVSTDKLIGAKIPAQKMANSLTGQGMTLVQNYLNNPSLPNLMAVQPILEKANIHHAPIDQIDAYLAEVMHHKGGYLPGGLIEGGSKIKK